MPDEIEPGPKPESNPANSSRLAPVAAPDSIPPGVQFGDVIDDVNVTYKEGDVAKVKFVFSRRKTLSTTQIINL